MDYLHQILCIYVSVHVSFFVCIWVCMCMYLYLFVCVCVCISVHLCMVNFTMVIELNLKMHIKWESFLQLKFSSGKINGKEMIVYLLQHITTAFIISYSKRWFFAVGESLSRANQIYHVHFVVCCLALLLMCWFRDLSDPTSKPWIFKKERRMTHRPTLYFVLLLFLLLKKIFVKTFWCEWHHQKCLVIFELESILLLNSGIPISEMWK